MIESSDPQAVVQSAEKKAGSLEVALGNAHGQLGEMLPLTQDTPAPPCESGLLGTLDHCLAEVSSLNTRLGDLVEKVGLVRP